MLYYSISSVTRFGNFCHFGKIVNVFGNFERVYLVLGKILDLLLQIIFTTVQISLVGNGQRLKNNLAI